MTPDEILAHVVVDPAAWKAHARVFAAKQWDRDKEHLDRLIAEVAMAGDDPLAHQLSARVAALQQRVEAGADLHFNELLNGKVERHRAEAEAAGARPGYKNRAEREAEAEAERVAQVAEQMRRRSEAETQRQVEFNARVEAQVRAVLAQQAKA